MRRDEQVAGPYCTKLPAASGAAIPLLHQQLSVQRQWVDVSIQGSITSYIRDTTAAFACTVMKRASLPLHWSSHIIIWATSAEGATNQEQSCHRAKLPSDLESRKAIAIDGPAASGKTAVGTELARRLDYRFLDTGGMYRGITLLALEAGIDLQDQAALTELAQHTRMEQVGGPSGDRMVVDGRDVTVELRARKVDSSVSRVSAVRGVRIALVQQQREVAEQGPIVMVGRDIGTVVLPDAKVKVYLNASVEVRTGRRVREMNASGRDASYERVLEELRMRDSIDSERFESPLRPDEEALIIDTDDMSVVEIADKVLQHFRPEKWS